MGNLSNYAVVVPALHPVREYLLPFLDHLLRLGAGAVVVVDDGSGDAYRATFDAAAERGCIILRHDTNQGKGRALKTGFQHCADNLSHLSGIITADSDGQHAPEDLARVAARHQELADEGRSSSVIGSRNFGGDDVPARSRFGNICTTGIIRVLFGRRVADTQSGLRCFPMELVPDLLSVRGDRFDYEMNQLLWMLATHKDVHELEIRTIYHDKSNSVSHFRPVRDSLKIYAIIFRQLFMFSAASAASAVLDLLLYLLLIDLVFGPSRSPSQVALAVVLARVGSSVVNLGLNRSLVFRARGSHTRAATRYYTLALALMLSSALGTATLSMLSGGHDFWAKIVTDSLLFLVSYLAQRRWVFAVRQSREAQPAHHSLKPVGPAR